MKLTNFINHIKKISSIQLFDSFKGNELERQIIIVLCYFALLFMLDSSGLMDLYEQNFVRRLINMSRRRDPLTYQKKLKPFCISKKNILDKEDIIRLQSIKIPQNTDLPWITRKHTTTHQCCKNFNEEEKEIIKDITEKIRQKYEKKIGKKLYYLGDNKATFYVYHGKASQHLWHVDPQNLSEIYNVIICVKKIGKISPLQCKDLDENINSIYFEEGDAALFNGGTTVHQVPPNDDDESERTVLSIAFTSDNKLNENKKYSNNMCTYIEGGNNYFNIIKLFLSMFVINYIISYISDVKDLSYDFLSILVIICLLIVKYIPLYFDIELGTGRSSSVLNNLMLLLVIMLLTLSPKGGSLFFLYFALSDVFFPRSWVEYD